MHLYNQVFCSGSPGSMHVPTYQEPSYSETGNYIYIVLFNLHNEYSIRFSAQC